MNRRFEIAEAARAEVTETHGELAALSVYMIVDQRRGYNLYAPVGDNGPAGPAIAFFNDQVQEL